MNGHVYSFMWNGRRKAKSMHDIKLFELIYSERKRLCWVASVWLGMPFTYNFIPLKYNLGGNFLIIMMMMNLASLKYK